MDADVAGGVICIVMGLFFFLLRGWLARQMIDFQRSNWGLNVLDERHVEGLTSAIRFNAVIIVLFGLYLIIRPHSPLV